MVSFWPFRGDDTSAASFEKVLSKLAGQISKTSTQNDSFRQKQRRYKVLWTLYSAFAYILVAAILTLVTGYQRWGPAEFSAVAGGPVLIYVIRTALDAYYSYRIANSQAYLNDLYRQREAAVAKLKEATKYDRTQQLLDKYGGTPRPKQQPPKPSGKRKPEGGGPQRPGSSQGPVPRTGFAPPPTANIQRPRPISPQDVPRSGPSLVQGSLSAAERAALGRTGDGPGEEFAPNAFSVSPLPRPPISQQPAQYSEGPKWYDRILDVVLGEDETQAKNRIALICQNCRLVNGQAPPGARSLEDVGRWRCSSCHAWNGVESEEKKVLKQISGEAQSPASAVETPTSAATEPALRTSALDDEADSGDVEHVDEDSVDEDGEDDEKQAETEDVPPAGSTRSKARQRRKPY